MARKIEFRAWDKEEERFIYSNESYDNHWFEFNNESLKAFGLSDIPSTIYEPPKAEPTTNEDRIRNVGGFIENKKGTDGLISWETYKQAHDKWIAMNGSISTFKAVYPAETMMDEGNLAQLPAGLRAKEEELTKSDREEAGWKWMETDEAKAMSDDEKASIIRSVLGLNPETFGIY